MQNIPKYSKKSKTFQKSKSVKINKYINLDFLTMTQPLCSTSVKYSTYTSDHQQVN
jgi:hypothetical protein